MTSTLASAPQRIEERYSLRNLDNFLAFSFAPNKRLCLFDKDVYGNNVKVLSEVDKENFSWKEYPLLWWKESCSLKKTCDYISENAPFWSATIARDNQRIIALERQCALLEKKVKQYNLTKLQIDNDHIPVTFSNPLKKTLQVVVSYPSEIGQTTIARASYPVVYDRLTTEAELKSRFQLALQTPVSIKVKADKSHSNPSKATYALQVMPANIFKRVMQDPSDLFNPLEILPKNTPQEVHVSYSDHDWLALSANMYVQGQSDAMPRVYQQGLLDGRYQGYAEAIAKVKSTFGNSR